MKHCLLKCAGVFLCAASTTLSVSASETFSWAGDADGSVTVPSGGAVIEDADVDAVSKLKTIVLADETSTVTASGLTAELALSASVSGPGSVTFTDCAAVTLSGDNSGLTGNFSFSDTAVLVTSRYGLGGEGTSPAVFVKGTDGTLSFSGNGLTNDVPLHVTGEIDLPYGTDDVFYQRGDIILTGDKMWFRNVVMESGLIGNTTYSFFMTVRPGCEFTVRPEASIRAHSDGSGLLYFMGELNKPVTGVICLETGDIDARAGLHHFNYVDALAFGAADVFAETVKLQVSLSNADAGIDLRGNDQTFAYIYPNSAESEGSKKLQTVRSADPATLKFTDTTGAAVSMPFKFTGAASFHYAGNGSYTIVNQISDTTGDLTVSSGTVAFDWNAGWGSGDVTVNGGELVCNSVNMLTGWTADLVVSDGGRITVAEGVVLEVASCRLGTTELEKGFEYGKAELDALGCGSYFSGDGTISVLSDGSEFVWPDLPGGDVKIPVDTEVTVATAEDAAKLMSYATVTLFSGSRLVVSDIAGDLVLSADMSGNGEIVMENITNVVITGDNSALAGGFTFTDCSVVVSNRYGLGSAATRYAGFTGASSLVFGGEGLTNDVALHIDEALVIQKGSDEELVQRGNVVSDGGDLRSYNMYIESGTVRNGTYNMSVRPHAGCRLRLGAGTTLTGGALYLIGDYTRVQPTHYIRLEGASFAGFSSVFFYNYSVGLELGTENAWPAGYEMGAALGDQGDGGLNLCGFTQTVPLVYPHQHTPAKGSTPLLSVSSEKPATLVITDTTAESVTMPFRFTGAAGFEYAGNGSYTIVNRISDTTGGLTVSSGTVTFDWGAGWGGSNVTVRSGATLAIATDSSGVGLYTEGGTRRNMLMLEDGGTLSLGENVCVTSYWAQVGGKYLRRGTYGGAGAGLDAAHTLDAISGSGRLVVCRTRNAGVMIIVR